MESTDAAVERDRLEQIQIEFELGRAYVAAQLLRERLELAGLDETATRVRRIQKEIALDLARRRTGDVLVAGPPCQTFAIADTRPGSRPAGAPIEP